jgi:hypothetical protein
MANIDCKPFFQICFHDQKCKQVNEGEDLLLSLKFFFSFRRRIEVRLIILNVVIILALAALKQGCQMVYFRTIIPSRVHF